MPTTTHVDVNSGDVLILAGTMKGAFVLRSDKSRQDWEVGGPYFPGRAIYALTYDDRNGRKRLWAAVNSSYWGSYLSSSDDFGKTWTEPEASGEKFPEGPAMQWKWIGKITLGTRMDPKHLFAEAEPQPISKPPIAVAGGTLCRAC